MIYIDLNSFNRSASGLITTGLSIHLEGEYFPEKEWNDSIVVLGWWANEISSFFTYSKHTADLRFMDGPFRITLSRDSEYVKLIFVRGEKEIRYARLDFERFKVLALKSMVRVLTQCIEKCMQKGWIDSDVTKLIQDNEMLRKNFPEYLN